MAFWRGRCDAACTAFLRLVLSWQSPKFSLPPLRNIALSAPRSRGVRPP